MNQIKSTYTAQSGLTMLWLHMVIVVVAILFFAYADQPPLGLLLLTIAVVMIKGYVSVKSNHLVYLTLFGEYKGVLGQSGLYWVNPLLAKKQIAGGLQHYSLQNGAFCDTQGLSLQASVNISWELQDHALAFGHLQSLQEVASQQAQIAMAYVFETMPYQAKEGASMLKGNKQSLESLLWQQLQERMKPFGLQLAEVALIHLAVTDEAYLYMLQQKQQQALEVQGYKNWALQTVPIATHIAKQLQARGETAKGSSLQELTEKITLALVKQGK